MRALFNGETAGNWAHSRGLHYGDGVFRTVLVHEGLPLDWDLHIAKLRQDCVALRLAPPSSQLLRDEVVVLVQGQAQAVVKLIIARQSGGRGYRAGDQGSDRLLLCYPPPRYPATNWTHGIQAFRCPLRIASQPALAGIKHLNRLEQVLASQDWPDGADEGILCDQASRPVCGTRSNLFWATGGRLHTPALTECGVAGMMRTKILGLAASLGIGAQVGLADWEELMTADEAFVCNALIGIWPIRGLEHRGWQGPGRLTTQLVSALHHPQLL